MSMIKKTGLAVTGTILAASMAVGGVQANYDQELRQALNNSTSSISSLNGISSLDLSQMDLETALMAVQSQRVQLLDQQLKQQIEETQRRNEQIARLSEALAAARIANDQVREREIKAQLDALSNSQQMDMLRLQSLSNKRNEAFDMMTDFIKKMQDSRASIINNMR